ncbi:protein HIRA-like [Anoplophora glabripennis]|nr:protein HIRA-like [Anoplophora glabripennis]
MACNRKTIVACCEDLTINCYDLKSGARSLPPLLIEDVVSSLSLSQNSYCLVLTKTGLLHMWDLQNSKSLLTRISVRSLLTGKGSVNGCSLSSTNQPVLTLSDGRAYSYCMNLQTWVQLSNPLDPVSGTGGNLIRRVPANLPLASLQRHMPVQRCMDTLPPGVTLSFLESQITATSVLQSAAEYRHWLIATVNHLLDKGPECRLRLVLDDLMGPNHTSSKKQKMDTRLEGTNRTLLNEVLAIIKTKLPWQRLYKEYSEQLSDP